MNDIISKYDNVYELPYLMGERFQVCQGYGGEFSHTEESFFSLDFTLPENTPVAFTDATFPGLVAGMAIESRCIVSTGMDRHDSAKT